MTKLILITLLILSLTLMCILFKNCKKLQKLLDNNNLTSAISYNNILCDMSEFEKQNTQENQNNQERNNLSCDKSVPSALDIAKYLIGLGQQNNRPITNLRLQKLLYYAWGNYWQNYQQNLFDVEKEPIEAWDWGPVVNVVYQEYKKYDDDFLEISNEEFNNAKKNISKEKQEFMEKFDIAYSKTLTRDMVNTSHCERPWRETYKENAQHNKINVELLREFFSNEF